MLQVTLLQVTCFIFAKALTIIVQGKNPCQWILWWWNIFTYMGCFSLQYFLYSCNFSPFCKTNRVPCPQHVFCSSTPDDQPKLIEILHIYIQTVNYEKPILQLFGFLHAKLQPRITENARAIFPGTTSDVLWNLNLKK